MGFLSNRDIALLLWLIPVVLYLLNNNKVRQAVIPILKAVVHHYVLMIFAVLFLYISIVVYLFWLIGYWNFDLLKATILWTFGSGVAGLFEYAKEHEPNNFFRSALAAQISPIIFVEYVATFNSFSLIWELITIPLVTVIGVMTLFSQREKQYESVHKLFSGLMSIFGIYLLTAGAYSIWNDPVAFWIVSTLRDFLLPILLSLAILPFFYMLITYISFEARFRGLSYHIDNEALRREAKIEAVKRYMFNVEGLNRWFHEVLIGKPKDSAGLSDAFDRVSERIKLENNPPHVSPKDGWSPFIASKFPKNDELYANHYRQPYLDSDYWYADSTRQKIWDDVFGNCLSYRVEGSDLIATRLTISLRVENRALEADALEAMDGLVSTVICKAIENSSLSLTSELKRLRSTDLLIDNYTVKIEHSEWINEDAFDLTVDLFHPNHKNIFDETRSKTSS